MAATPYRFTVRLAGIDIGVEVRHERSLKMCRSYLVDGKPRFNACVSQHDIDFERDLSDVEQSRLGLEPQPYPDDYLETLALYRAIAERLPLYGGVVFHGSVVAVDGEAYAFAALSGTGKSTHARLWREAFGSRAVMVNDDKPILRAADGRLQAFGTPWDGKHHLSSNMAAPLKGIALLERAAGNSIGRISPSEAWAALLQQTYRPHTAAAMEKTLGMIDLIASEVPVYRLRCNMDPSAARIAYEAMCAPAGFAV